MKISILSFFYKCKNSKKKFKLTFHEELNIDIEKIQKTFDFYDIYSLNYKPFYSISPLFLIIQKNNIEIFNNLLKIIQTYNFKIKIGIELEFYILGNTNLNIIKSLKKLLPEVENIEKEKGKNQFEIKTFPYLNINKLVQDYSNIQNKLYIFCKDNGLELNLEALPSLKDCGSALQINFSLIEENGNNLFARNSIENENQTLMLNCVAGLLKNINNSLLLYINNEKSLIRYDLNINSKLVQNKKYPAPTFVSWGINNRSTAIRIPTPPVMNLLTYKEEDNKNRRIEFRIPSADANIYNVLIGVFYSIIDGIENNLKPKYEKTSFNVLEKHENLEKILTDFKILNDQFKLDLNILFY